MAYIRINSKKYGVKIVYFDEDDRDKIEKHIWCVGRNRGGFYAMTNLKLGDKLFKSGRMHHLIVPYRPVDHKDRNGLNNRKSNLRKTTLQENIFNTGLTSRNKTGYKGVSIGNGKKFVASIRYKGKLIYGGLFDNKKDAAMKYNELAILYHKEFAFLNKV